MILQEAKVDRIGIKRNYCQVFPTKIKASHILCAYENPHIQWSEGYKKHQNDITRYYHLCRGRRSDRSRNIINLSKLHVDYQQCSTSCHISFLFYKLPRWFFTLQCSRGKRGEITSVIVAIERIGFLLVKCLSTNTFRKNKWMSE